MSSPHPKDLAPLQLGQRPVKIGLAFSGGATRGVAHIGVLQAFEEFNIRPSFIAGTSIGAMLGSVYAFGVPIDEIRRQAEAMSWTSVSSFSISRNGLLSNRVIGEVVIEMVGDVNIEDSPVPLAIVATDIATGDKVVLREGNLARAIRASTCIPGVFTPIKREGRLLVDGFLTENVPISPLTEMGADLIIGINLGTQRLYREPSSIINIMLNAFDISIDSNTMTRLQDADFIIKPDLKEIIESDSEEASALYEAGYKAARAAIPSIQTEIYNRSLPKGEPTLWQRFRDWFMTPLNPPLAS